LWYCFAADSENSSSELDSLAKGQPLSLHDDCVAVSGYVTAEAVNDAVNGVYG
jgi:hypothetical protein